jgi:16S rRNA C1402 (ribose-2'-O) methylase RsmI
MSAKEERTQHVYSEVEAALPYFMEIEDPYRLLATIQEMKARLKGIENSALDELASHYENNG